MSRNADAKADIAHRLYAALIAGDRHHLPTVARRSGLSDELIYKLCRGERELLVRHLPPLYRGTHDLELLAGLVDTDHLGLVITERRGADATKPADTHVAALHLGATVGNVQRLAVAAEADGLVTDAEATELEKQLQELERKAESLRQVLGARRVRIVRSGE